MYRLISLLLAAAAGVVPLGAAGPSLTYFGRATVRITTSTGFVVYIDPFAPGDHSAKADLVLVTHGHGDHNAVDSIPLDRNCTLAAPAGALKGRDCRIVKEGDAFQAGPVAVKVVPAYNRNHKREASVGYLVTADGVTVYHAGDTSFIPEMAALAASHVDYALFPTDGHWNMGGEEARRCADAVKASHALAIHSSPDGLYDAGNAARLAGPDILPLPQGQTISLVR